MQQLEERISAWRQEIGTAESIGNDALRELESHLRDAIDGALADGCTLQEAFDQAVIEVGDAAKLESEFRKVCPEFSWAKRFIWMLSGFALVTLLLRLTSVAQQIAENLALRWFPGVTITLPEPVTFEGPSFALFREGTRHLDQFHISAIAGPLVWLLATGLVLCFGYRCIKGRAPNFDRFFAACHAKRSLAFILITCSFILLAAGPTFWRFVRRIAFPEFFRADDIHVYGVSEMDHYAMSLYLGSFAGMVRIVLLTAFSIWAILHLRKQNRSGRRFVAWMFAGYFVVTGLVRLAGVGGALSGSVTMAINPEFASREWMNYVLPQMFCSYNASLVSAIVQIVLCIGMVALGLKIVASGRAPRIEKSFPWLWRCSIPLLLIWQAPSLWMQFMSHFAIRKAAVSTHSAGDAAVVWAELQNGPLYSEHALTPWVVIALTVVAGWALLREERDHKPRTDTVSA